MDLTHIDAGRYFTHATASRIARKAATVALAGSLVLATTPVTAFAAEAQGGGTSSSQPGEPPEGGAGPGSSSSSGQPGEPPSGGGGGGAAPGGGGANTMSYDYSGSYSATLTADSEQVSSDGETLDASTSDQNAALAQNGGTLTITSGTLTKSGDDTNGDNCNFYGVNSIVTAVGENSLASILSSKLSATSEGSNALFATDSATIYANDIEIETTAGNSRGLDATYGGTIVASGVTATTNGGHSATVATDRGGGYVSLTNSTLATNGSGSPLLYSTGDIEVSDVTGTASESQIAAMEGLNTILINNSQLTSSNTDTTGSDPIANGIIIYQSTSGDAESTTGETATFQVADSTLTSSIASGSMFYLTNTSADIVLARTTLSFDTGAANLLLAAGNDSNNWGSAGSNGATVKLTGIEQQLEGTIEADTISSVDLHLTNGSSWTGKAVISENAAGSTSEAPITVNVDGTSSWVVTESCTVSALNVAEGARIVDESGKTVSIVANGETVVSGDSDITVTVTGSYSTSYDASSASTLTSDVIDRSGFDEQFGTSTSWTMGDSANATTQASATTEQAATTEAAQETTSEDSPSNPFVAFFQWLGSLFGL